MVVAGRLGIYFVDMFSCNSALFSWRTLANQTVSIIAGLAHRTKTAARHTHPSAQRLVLDDTDSRTQFSTQLRSIGTTAFADSTCKPFRISLYEVKQSKASPPEGTELDANHATQQR
jgi:hypothetical protein